MELANGISMSFLAVGVGPAVMFLWTGKTWWLTLIAALFVVNAFVAALKEVFGSVGWFGRPAGAYGCDAFCLNGPVGGRPGFPSGHMTTVTMFVASLWFRFGDKRILWVGVPWIVAMAWARWFKRCHNLEQIAGGIVVGLVGSVAYTQLVPYTQLISD
jgi:membrane-associated phospholipid phosphatase